MSQKNVVDSSVPSRPRSVPLIAPSSVDLVKGTWVLHVPRFAEEGTHYHTYGMLTPYFKGLTEGRLMATRCINAACPISRGDGELWVPPRADCPDCHQPMVWHEVPEPRGYVYTYTLVERGGTGLEIPTPYYQIDVRIPGLCTIVKSYLVGANAPLRIGQGVRAAFRTGDLATHTALDLYFVPDNALSRS
ncbi:MAG: OB-fold domain-containing protein [Thermoanaerobaculia bacterium]